MKLNISLNEVEAAGKKAARGAGFPWGVAEEAGRAARWLCSNGLGGCGKLSEYLEFAESDPCFPPDALEVVWTSERGDLCPLLSGACLSDVALHLRDAPIEMRAVRSPVILLPFAAWAALALKDNITISMEDVTTVTDGIGLSVTRVAFPAVSDVTVALGGVLEQPLLRYSRAEPRIDSWQRLNRFAHKTYAPATEESRLLGAGAGLSDND